MTTLTSPAPTATDASTTYDRAVDHLVRYQPEVVDLAMHLVSDEPSYPMGLVLAAYLSLTSTDVPDLPGARECAAQLASLRLSPRESAHRAAIDRWIAGDWHGASATLDDLLVTWPDDTLGLVVGHQLDFFRGDAANLRDRVARSLGRIDPDHRHVPFMRGMFAFGLEESGSYGLAETHGLAAVEANPEDVWAIHAIAHVYEMQGRVDEGISFLLSRQADWGDGNMFLVHNWWHLAVYLLEAGRVDDALSIYDARVHNAASACVPLEMVDASALLWRLLLDGRAEAGRFDALADAWATRTAGEPWYVFNDVHACMALAGAGRVDDARAVVDRLSAYVAGSSEPQTNRAMTREIGISACRAVLATVEGDHQAVIDDLLPIRRVFQHFGGSHAQRDALQRTLLVAAIKANDLDLAEALVSERLALRETSVYGLTKAAEIADARGDGAAATAYARAAASHRGRFAAAT